MREVISRDTMCVVRASSVGSVRAFDQAVEVGAWAGLGAVIARLVRLAGPSSGYRWQVGYRVPLGKTHLLQARFSAVVAEHRVCDDVQALGPIVHPLGCSTGA